jgi:glycosyltransferase involved in cell wall biosynthesis
MFDIVITTYNRPAFIESLVKQINQCSLLPQKIIIVDSSETENKKIRKLEKVVYVRTSHKNQPYQRFLGLNISKEEIVIFFDDDVQILDIDLFKYLTESFNDKSIVGATLKFSDAEKNATSLSMGIIEKQSNKSLLHSLFWTLTGAPPIKNNHIWLAGLKGSYDYSLGYTEAIGGPGTLAFRRKIAFHLFNVLLFSMYEKKLGKGEDKYISMEALKYGKIALIDKVCLFHPPHSSSYFKNVYSFAHRDIYSRLWLSKRIAGVKNYSSFVVHLHYYWYAMWRIIIAGIHTLYSPKKANFDRFKGRCKGVWDTFVIPMKTEYLTPGINWQKELVQDLQNNRNSHE